MTASALEFLALDSHWSHQSILLCPLHLSIKTISGFLALIQSQALKVISYLLKQELNIPPLPLPTTAPPAHLPRGGGYITFHVCALDLLIAEQ